MKTLLTLLALLLTFCAASFGQDHSPASVFKKFGFTEHRIISKNDTIYFYLNAKGQQPKKNLVLYLSGSTPDPLFTFETVRDTMQSYFWGHQDYKLLSEEYTFAVIAKKGMQGLFDETKLNTRKPPQSYVQHNSMDYRVWQADQVINYCAKKLLNGPEKVIVYGHSEGFNVVAKLVTVNKKITHAGLWAGSAMPDYYDFMLFNRWEYLKGEVSDSVCAKNMDTLLMNYQALFNQPNGAEPNSIYTNKRWISYAEPSINHLLKTNIPLYMLVATKDENAPIESAYIVPLEFTRNRKQNLTFKTCVGCNHSFAITNPDKSRTSFWNDYFKDFIAWTNLK